MNTVRAWPCLLGLALLAGSGCLAPSEGDDENPGSPTSPGGCIDIARDKIVPTAGADQVYAIDVPFGYARLEVEAWMNSSEAGPYFALDIVNLLDGPFVGLYPGSDFSSPVAQIKFSNEMGAWIAPMELGHGNVTTPVETFGLWHVGFGARTQNVHAEFIVQACG